MSSVFDAPTTEQDQTDQTTGQDNPETQEDWLNRVVSEKGEHWKDPQTIAKGYYHAQQRIKELEGFEEKAKQQDYAKTLLEQLQEKQAKDVAPDQPEVDERQSNTENKDHTSLSPEDIERLLESTLSAREKSQKVEKALRERFGTGANRVVHDRAKELGMSIEKMQALATDSPDAFLRLVGEPEAQQTNTTRQSTVNTASGFNRTGGDRNSAYYAKVRRENRKLYNSPKVQSEMLQDRVRLGDKFYT